MGEQIAAAAAAAAKYGVHTKSASDGADVRWYFCKIPLRPNEAAAQVPASEVVGKGKYFRFSVRDSLALEASFVQREEELVSAWWKEYAEVSEGPVTASGRLAPNPSEQRNFTEGYLSRTRNGGKDQLSYSGNNAEIDDGESVGVLVKSGLYEVDLMQRRCIPVYWRGEHRRVLRGHWYVRKGGLDWLPLREDVAEQLEIAYHRKIWRRRSFQPSGLYAARVNLTGTSLGLHALFMGEDDTWEAILAVDASGISFVLGLKGNGVKLRRGFAPPDSAHPTQDELRQRKEEEMDDYASQVPVRHVVFMVHGIGQRLEKANLVDDVGAFRQTVSALAEQHLTPHQRNAQRILFIPCQWRRELKLGGEVAMERITLEGVRALRTMITATVHDVLYYMSPAYCQDIIDSVTQSLNRLYIKFIKRNPNFDGKVSLYGHSLGSVLTYDILCHQDTLMSAFPVEKINASIMRNDETDDDMPRIDRLPATTETESGSEDGSSMHNSDISCRPSTLSETENNSIPGVQPSDATLDLADDTIEDRIPEEIETMENVKEKESLTEGIPPEEDTTPDIAEETEEVRIPEQIETTEEEKEKSILMEEEVRGPETARDDDPVLQQSFSRGYQSFQKDSEFGSLQGTMDTSASLRKQHRPFIIYPKLEFKVDTFYAVGSPLGMFLALRNVRIGLGTGVEYWQDEGIDEEMPACRLLLNIFHPYDPVAYRLEPLVCKEYVDKRPVFIPYHKGGKRLHIGFQEFSEDLSMKSKAFVQSIGSVGVSSPVLFHCCLIALLHRGHSDGEFGNDEKEKKMKQKTYGQMVMERLTGSSEGRIDFMLQDSTFEHQYLSAMSCHTSYWQDPDTALFILKHLYHDIPEEPPSNDSTTMEPLIGTIDDDGGETPRQGVPESPPSVVKIEHAWDSGDEDSSSFFSKEEFVAALSSTKGKPKKNSEKKM
ncbi:unnamed protein product [Sphagnum troendelagicum]|uniref:DDHD domain-containing protein n=1 Tax=Sphagnum troendelagicum TaxID=128251 RepID=A0ABP0TDR4_9BRYO